MIVGEAGPFHEVLVGLAQLRVENFLSFSNGFGQGAPRSNLLIFGRFLRTGFFKRAIGIFEISSPKTEQDLITSCRRRRHLKS